MYNKGKLIRLFIWILVFTCIPALVLFPEILWAQCPMCKASVESNLASGQSIGAGLNKGILFLLVMPYLAASFIAYMFYKNYKLRKKKQMEKLS